MRNYSVRTMFKYPSPDREISEVVGHRKTEAVEEKRADEGRKKGKDTVQRRQRKEKEEEEEEGRIGYNSASGTPKLVSRSGNVSLRPRPRYLFCAMTIRVGGRFYKYSSRN